MKKKILLVSVLASVFSFAQVGVNTGNPQSAFHVDGGKDNPSTGVPNTAQQSNDMVITKDGNVGIGTIIPTNELTIRQRGDNKEGFVLQTPTNKGSDGTAVSAGSWSGGSGFFRIYGEGDTSPKILLSGASNINSYFSYNLGIGTTSPSTKLHIDNGATAGAIRIVDGTQGDGKVFTSDANGVGTWRTPVTNSGSSYTGSTSVSLNGTSFERAALTGDVTAAANSNTTTVTKIQGTAVAAMAPTIGQVLKYDGTNWIPTADTNTTYNASNGLTMISDNIKLGGVLTEPTNITGLSSTNKLAITGTGVDAVNIASNTLSVDAANKRIGVGTQDPKATMDIVATPTDTSAVDGLIAPRLKGSELKTKDNLYTQATGQTGTIVYVTEALTIANTSPKTINVTSVGYYYFDGSIWQKFTPTEPWNVSGTLNTPANSNTQDIYQLGRVSVGNTGSNTDSRLRISDINISGDTGNTYGINNSVTTNRQGIKYGLQTSLTDNSTSAGANYGISSQVTDNSSAAKIGTGASFNYNLNTSRNNGTNIISTTNSMTMLTANGGDITSTGTVSSNQASIVTNTQSGNINLATVSTYFGSFLPIINSGRTMTLTDYKGLDLTFVPANAGTLNITGNVIGVDSFIAPGGTSGANYTANNVIGYRSNFVFNTNAGTRKISNLYGMKIDRTIYSQGTGSLTIDNTYGLYISDYRFNDYTSAANAYNLYSEGAATKNYFQGRIGVGITAPSAQLHIVKQASDLTPAIIEGCSEYASNALAKAAGLPVGALYRTGEFLKIVY